MNRIEAWTQGRILRTGGYLWVSDLVKSMGWYERTLSLRALPFPDTRPYMYVRLKGEHCAFCLLDLVEHGELDHQAAPLKIEPTTVWIDVFGVVEFHASVKRRASECGELAVNSQGVYEFSLRDPDGHLLVFSEAVNSARRQQ